MVTSMGMLYLFYKMSMKVHQEKESYPNFHFNGHFMQKRGMFRGEIDDLDTNGMQSFINNPPTLKGDE
jgi:hypothetical protein